MLDELADDVIERLKHALMHLNVPVAMRHDIVAGAGLRFGGGGQLVLFALRRDVVDVDFDFVFLAPLVADLVEGLVGAGHPMVPAAERQLAGGVCASDIGRGNNGGRAKSSGLENGATCNTCTHSLLPMAFCFLALKKKIARPFIGG